MSCQSKFTNPSCNINQSNCLFLQELADTFTKTGGKVRETKTTILLNKIALLVVPEDDVEMKGKLCDSLTTHCFNTDQLDDCITYAKQAIEINSRSIEVCFGCFFFSVLKHNFIENYTGCQCCVGSKISQTCFTII